MADDKPKPAAPMNLDFTNVQEGGGAFRKIRQVAGEYKGRITKVQTVKNKKTNEPQWLWTIKVGPGVYPYYTPFAENQLWKIRNLFVAAGKVVPRKRVKVNPESIVGKDIGVILADDDYDGKEQSSIDAVLPVSELEDSDDPADEEEEPTEGDTADEEEEPEAPVAGDDDLDELEVEEL